MNKPITIIVIATIEERTVAMQKLDGFFPLNWDEGAGALWEERTQ